MLKRVAKCSTSAQPFRMERLSRIPSSALTEPFSTRKISLANGTFHLQPFTITFYFLTWNIPELIRWPDVECASSSDFFSLNENIGKIPERLPGDEQQVVIAAASPIAVVAPAPEPAKAAEPIAVAVPLPAVIQPAVQAQAIAVSQSVVEPAVATASAAAVVIPAQLDSVAAVAVPAPLEAVAVPAAEIAYESAAAASPEVQAVIIPELIAPVEIPAPEVISIRDEPVQQVNWLRPWFDLWIDCVYQHFANVQVVQVALPQAPSSLYETPDASSSGAQYKY